MPKPSAYTLHKYIISERRKNDVKAVKDFETAKDMSRFLLSLSDQRVKLKEVYSDFAKGWQKTLLGIIEKEDNDLYELLKG